MHGGKGTRAARQVHERLERRELLAARIVGSATAYATIQAAINAAAAGATINVDAGSYAETLTVNKALTLRGAQAGVDPRANLRREAGTSAETVLSGATVNGVVRNAFYVSASGVTLDGFTVQGTTYTDSARGAGIVLAPNINGTQVLNNVVQNNVAGLFLSNNSDAAAAVIRHNVFRNNNNAGANGGRGIYTDQVISGGKLTNVQIDENVFYRNYGGSGTTSLEAAIALESGTTATSQTSLKVTNNVFEDNGKAILAFNLTGLLFSGNTVTRGRDWYSGIVRFEGNDHDVTITNNNLYANTGPAVAIDTKGVPGDNSGFVVSNNNIYGNGTTSGKQMGVVYDGDVYDGTLDARNNYWGAATGPSGDGPGTGDSVYGIGHVVSGSSWYVATGGDERYSPWLTAPIDPRDTAYWGLAATDGARVQAEDFNNGGQGVAYNDTTGGNSGGQYRTTGVDVSTTADAGGGYAATSTAAGEWLDYSLNLARGGTYQLDLRLASAFAGASLRVLVDGVQIGADTAALNTGSTSTFTTVSLANLSITGGAHVVRIFFVANNTGGAGPALNWFQLTNTSAVATPGAPTGLTAAATSSSEIALAWTNATGVAATGIKVQRSTDGVAFTTIATLAGTATSYTSVGLNALTTYYFRVLATNAGGDSPASNVASDTTGAAAVTPLTSLAWTSATSDWNTPQENKTIKGLAIMLRGTTYATGVGTHANSTITYNLAGRFTTFTSAVGVDDETGGQGAVDFKVYGDGVLLYDSGLLTGTSAAKSLSVSVAGVTTLKLVASAGPNGSIDYAHADWAGAQLLRNTTPAPAAPSGLTATLVDATSVRLNWTAGDAAQTSFGLERSADNGASWSVIATPTATTYTDAGLAPGTTYLYRVRASNAGGNSAYSSTVTIKTSPALTPVQLSTLAWTSATIGWGSVTKDASVKGSTLTLRGQTYSTGIGTHSDSQITYDLAGQYTSFTSDVGVDDAAGLGRGSVVFQVIGDGKVLFDSGLVTGSTAAVHVAVSVAGVRTLTLSVTNGGDGIDYDQADWAGAQLTPAPAPVLRTGTTIGTAGSSAANTTIAAATDGDLSTYFEGPVANGNWVGLDLGAAQSVSQIAFAPRASYASRMVGGIFQVSDTADFSSGVTNLYTITTAPAEGVLTTITLSAPVAGRYFRYLAPDGSWGNIAELQFLG